MSVIESARFDWSAVPVWRFCQVSHTGPTVKYAVKVVSSIESPYVGEKECDGPLVIRTLVSSAQKLVGYSFTFREQPAVGHPSVKEFGFSLAAAYGIPDTEEMMLVLGSPHLRVIRSGKEKPCYHVVLRHK